MTVLLAGGAPPTHEMPLRLLHEADRLIACDGAWRTALALGRSPDAVVGDGDSLGPDGRSELERLGIALVVGAEQETNDLCKAFRYAVDSMGDGDALAILGATGLREDHSIGNIFHLIDFAEELRCRCGDSGEGHALVTVVTDHGVFEPVLPLGRAWNVNPHQPVSVFAPLPGTEMDSEGLEWSLGGVAFDALWRGTLNRATGNSFSLRTNRPAIAYLPYV